MHAWRLCAYTGTEANTTAIVVMLCAGIPFLDSAAEHITRKIEQFSPQDAANAVWAYARLFHYPNQAFLRVRCPACSTRACASVLHFM